MGQILQNAGKAAWATVLCAYRNARAAEDNYDELVWTPAYHTDESGGPAIPAEVNAEIERLQEVRIEAEDALVLTPAPTLSDVLLKIETARRRWEGFGDWPDDWWDAVLSDLRGMAQEG